MTMATPDEDEDLDSLDPLEDDLSDASGDDYVLFIESEQQGSLVSLSKAYTICS